MCEKLQAKTSQTTVMVSSLGSSLLFWQVLGTAAKSICDVPTFSPQSSDLKLKTVMLSHFWKHHHHHEPWKAKTGACCPSVVCGVALGPLHHAHPKIRPGQKLHWHCHGAPSMQATHGVGKQLACEMPGTNCQSPSSTQGLQRSKVQVVTTLGFCKTWWWSGLLCGFHSCQNSLKLPAAPPQWLQCHSWQQPMPNFGVRAPERQSVARR